MLNNLKKNNKGLGLSESKGFTIIEVLIVLAIAGLILLIVFLAVPALQRNSRNTQRRNEVAAALGAVNEYVANSGGTLPSTDAAFNTAFTNANVDFKFYTPANVTYDYSATVPASVPTNTNVNNVVVYTFLKCSGNNATTTGASSRSVIALFAVEGSSTSIQQCTEA